MDLNSRSDFHGRYHKVRTTLTNHDMGIRGAISRLSGTWKCINCAIDIPFKYLPLFLRLFYYFGGKLKLRSGWMGHPRDL